MKKIIPLLTILGIGLITTGCASDDAKTLNIDNNINEFKSSFAGYTNAGNNSTSILNKYKLSINPTTPTQEELDKKFFEEKDYSQNRKTKDYIDYNKDFYLKENKISAYDLQPEDMQTDINKISSDKQLDPAFSVDMNDTLPEQNQQNEILDTNNTNEIDSDMQLSENSISNLYAISDDIENYTQQYLTLKKDMLDAIDETNKLIEKVKTGELKLTAEQRMMITSQSNVLKDFAKKLTNSTSELNIYLSEISNMLSDGQQLDDLTLKYLVVLDNLANGNELIKESFASVLMLNQMFNLNNGTELPYARAYYGFKRNNQPAQFREVEINNGEIVKDNSYTQNSEQTTENTEENNQNETTLFGLTPNIDSYKTNYSNIDSFFNTALLNNQFMYGNNGFAGNGLYGAYTPYVNNNMYGNNVSNEQNTEQSVQKKKKKKLEKNIDTYKDSSTPDLKTRFRNFKKTLAFSKPKIKNPVYRYNDDSVSNEQNTENEKAITQNEIFNINN